MRGDILLYYSTGKWYEKVISWITRGPFTHVAVDMGNGTNIAAHMRGVGMELNLPEYRMVRASVAKDADPQDLKEALDWLHSQVGKPYGWLQIIDYGLGVLGLPIFFFQKGHNDCSTLVSKYLCRIDPTHCVNEPDLMSPNDIARQLGVIPSKKR